MQEIAIVVGGLGALIGLIAVSVASGNLVDVDVSAAGSVVVRLRGLNKIWAFKSKIVVPTGSIRAATVKRLERMPLGLRLPGTSVPGLIVAGSYREKGTRSFFAIRRKHEVLELELDDFKYDRIVVETADPEASADAIRAVLGPAG